MLAALLALCEPLASRLEAQNAPPAAALARREASDTMRLTIADARAAALRANPELAATRLETEIARGLLRQAGVVRFNPSADVLSAGASGNGLELSVSQEVEIAGQRGARRAVARAGVARAQFTVADAARLTLADVGRAFYRAVAADRRAALATEVLQLNERLAQVSTRQLREGEISKLDYNLAIVEVGRARARALAARREQQQSVIALRRVTGLPAELPLIAVFDSSVHRHVVLDSLNVPSRTIIVDVGAPGDATVVQLVARALAQRPDLAERGAAVAQAEADVSLARRQALPNLVTRVLTAQNAAGTGQSLRPGVGLSIPLFNRNQGEIETRRAIARRVVLERSATATLVRAEVESALRAYEAAAGEVEVLETTVLGPARDNRRLLEAAYREGKVGLPVLLLIRNQVIDAEQEYWSAWLAERDAIAALTAAVGVGPLPPAPEPR